MRAGRRGKPGDFRRRCTLINADWFLGLREENRSRDRAIRDLIHKSDPERFLRMDFFCQQKHLQSSWFADQAWKPLSAAPTRDQAERCSAMAEDGVGGGNTVVAGEGQIETSAHTVAAYGRDDRNRESINVLHKALPYTRELERLRSGELRDFVEIGSGREEAIVSGDDEAPDTARFGLSPQHLPALEQRANASDG